MKQSLQLRLGQQLTMTPQLQQAIRLLQLPAAELNLEIREALESNVMLEALEADDEAMSAGLDASETDSEHPRMDPSEVLLGSDAADASRLGEGIPGDERWDEPYDGRTTYSTPNYDQPFDTLENRAAPEASLKEHLQWQLELSGLSETDQRIGAIIIDALNEQGHLSEPLTELPIEYAEGQAVLAFIQHLDPLGVAALDARSALAIQLDAMPSDTAYRDLAQRLLRDYFELLGHGQHAALCRQLAVDQPSLDQAIRLIQSLDPHPGSAFGQARTEYVVPDCVVQRLNGRWVVDINPEASPRLRVNDYYASLVRRGDQSADNHLMREHLQQARWLIKSLHSRNATLQKVAECIVERQQAFLEHGEQAMQPLILREVAEAVEMHESTISRITTQKYMRTPQGTLEFKYFFSSHVPTADGGECSATAIRARIRRLVASEDPTRPLSDAGLTQILHDQGIQVARRTVAKYREVIGIASSTDRKRPA